MTITVYKYIGFKNDYWDDVLVSDAFYFSTIPQLHTVNDDSEFKVDWTHATLSKFGFEQEMSPHLDRHFGITRVLCVAKKLNQLCLREFCGDLGGVCYQFEYDSALKHPGITCKDVIYSCTKNMNLADHYYSAMPFDVQRFFADPHASSLNTSDVCSWLLSASSQSVLTDFLLNEISFKKIKGKYSDENELRFVHIEGQEPDFSNKYKIGLSILGMKLVKIYSTDPDRVNSRILGLNKKIEVDVFPFLQGPPY